MTLKKIQSALLSVFNKEGLEPLARQLHAQGATLYSTGGTQKFLEGLGLPVTAVEDLTGYPSILGGRVKTLHPKVFGGILNRREHTADQQEVQQYQVPPIDMVVVDLYPFEETVAAGGTEEAIIEKIDIGGISLIRGAAKNFNDVLIVSHRRQYAEAVEILTQNQGQTSLEQRRQFAQQAFEVSSHYDAAIYRYFTPEPLGGALKLSMQQAMDLRYGENPHQPGRFYGHFNELFEQLHGKAISYNNLLDIDAAVALISEFEGQTAFAIIKHNNACGVATAGSVKEAYQKAFAADTMSPFGGILISNSPIDVAAAEQMNKLFFEILIAPGFEAEALTVLKSKKNRILLQQKGQPQRQIQYRSLLNGVIAQAADTTTETEQDLKTVTERVPTQPEVAAMLFAAKLVKHTKSNAIVLATQDQLLASGTGQTSRVDALEQAIAKAQHFGMDLKGAAMASDAFFPFADCVEIASKAGITAVIQPGGSIRDQESIDYCNANQLAMVVTGVRHFKH